ncbi:unnamed protein product [Microthlaspi erraticum]|uniref:Uncharacterized protein n=1 Tax=Microthlaspi erraticum TaxID=1685480 RepID=A0A6D2K5U5_9BRAS|nr:unnamed protein product [Microthlaspi erraticum]
MTAKKRNSPISCSRNNPSAVLDREVNQRRGFLCDSGSFHSEIAVDMYRSGEKNEGLIKVLGLMAIGGDGLLPVKEQGGHDPH